MKHALTAERVRELLHYEVVTGRFYWKHNRKLELVGSRAGCPRSKGYRAIRVGGCRVQEHQLAHLWITGEWPEALIDHINHVKDSNGWHNLREATREENGYNARLRRDSTSGVKGVSWDASRGKWMAQVSTEGKTHHAGRFETLEEAAAAIKTFRELHHGDFAAH
jgi:hypothetical protein